jgi:copper/silver efflux system protein
MRQDLDVLFRLRVVQPKLAQERPVLVQHRNSGVSSTMAIGNVNVAVLWIHIDGRGTEELRCIRVEGFPFRGAIGGIENARFPDLKKELVRIFLHETGTRRSNPHIAVLVHLAVVEVVSENLCISPGIDQIALGIELHHRRSLRPGLGPLESISRGHHGLGQPFLPVQDEHMVPGNAPLVELDGGEVASGIVLQCFGANALDVIDNVKKRVSEIAGSLPKGVDIVAVYDRSTLIAAIETLRHTLLEESAIVALACVVFLLHVRSALVAILMLPVGVLMAFAAMKALGLGSNIMSLGGIAIAIGAMVDAAIVMIENAHKHLERAAPGKPRLEILIAAATEVGPALFFSLLIITVSFLPIFSLEAQEDRLFSPLASTKTFSMAAAALLSVTLVPALMVIFVRGRIIPEQRNPLNKFLIWLYRPIIAVVLKAKVVTIVLAFVVLGVTLWPASRLGSEFMPNLDEGTLFYMPTTLPGISITKAADLLQSQDRIIKSFPEVLSVYGKAGRASTATDPAPTEMFETVINLKPKDQWRPGVTSDSLIAEMDKTLQFPGVSNAWTMPIKARIDMLSTGIRTPVGVKVFGADLGEIERVARQIEQVLKTVPGTSSAYAERIIGGYYLDITPDRSALARYGLMVGDVQDVVATALGGDAVTTTVEGR